MLERIKTPKDIKRLHFEELQVLAKDVRKRIIEVTSVTGGHIAPSLGATDFIVALLKVFDPLEDRIVFDVGHQSYAYKILTERNDRFDTLRTYGGISGFNNIFESPYDAFSVGHSSTSISAAFGICMAKEHLKEKGHSIAVIGDGALTGGMAFEAINHAGHMQKNFIIILNDNDMSISRNVGALQNYLTNMLTSKSYNFMKKQVWDLSQTLPTNIRRKFITGAQKLEESLMNILVPNILFEDLGFKYVGPIDGHDIPRLTRIFHKVKENMVGPVLIHLITKKGKGYSFAENQASKFHGVGPFDKNTGVTGPVKSGSWSEIFGNKLIQLAEKNERVVAITAAMAEGTGLMGFQSKYPKRFYDVGIAEQHAVTFAGGLAKQGMKPFVAIYSTFLQRGLDQVIHDVALQKLPVVFCLDRAGLVGEDGATHHGVFDLSYLQLIPNLVVIAPSHKKGLVKAMEWAMNYQDGPVAIRYPRGCAEVIDNAGDEISLGKSEILEEGKDLAIIGVGTGVGIAKDLKKMIAESQSNIDPMVVNLKFVKPLDEELMSRLIREFNRVVVIEENAIMGGVASSFALRLSEHRIAVHGFGIPDHFVTHGKTELLKEEIGFTTLQIYEKLFPNDKENI